MERARSGYRRVVQQVHADRRWLIVIVIGATGVTLLAPLAAAISGGAIDPTYLLVDPTDVAATPWYLGAISELNLLVWAAAAALYLVLGIGFRGSERTLATAMTALGLVSVWFALDDQFLIHEDRVRDALAMVGVQAGDGSLLQPIVFAVYGLVLLAVLARYAPALVEVEGVAFLALALAAMASSVLLDASGIDATGRRVAEEAAKLTGAVAWLVFPAVVVVHRLRGATTGR